MTAPAAPNVPNTPPPRPAAASSPQATPPHPQPQPRQTAPVPNTVTRHAPRRDESLMDRVRNSWKVWAGVGLAAILLVVWLGWMFFLAPSPSPSVGGGIVVQKPAVTQTAPQNFDFGSVKSLKVTEYSPALVGHMDARSIVVVLFSILVAALLFADWWMRRSTYKSNKAANIGVFVFNTAGGLAGLLTVPILNWSGAAADIWFLLAVVFVVMLWVLAAASVFAFGDSTALIVGFALMVSVVYMSGTFLLPSQLGKMMGITLGPWTGIKSVAGAVNLMMGFRWGEMMLTVLMFALCAAALTVAAIEAGKKLGGPTTIALAVVMSIAWWGSLYLSNAGFTYLQTQMEVQEAVLLLEIVKSPVAWLLAQLVSIGLGFWAAGRQVSVPGQGSVNIGFEGERSAVTVVDFLMFSAVLSLVSTVVVVL